MLKILIVLTICILTSACTKSQPAISDENQYVVQAMQSKIDIRAAPSRRASDSWDVDLTIYKPASDGNIETERAALVAPYGDSVTFTTRTFFTSESEATASQMLYKIILDMPKTNDGTPITVHISYEKNGKILFKESRLVPMG